VGSGASVASGASVGSTAAVGSGASVGSAPPHAANIDASIIRISSKDSTVRLPDIWFSSFNLWIVLHFTLHYANVQYSFCLFHPLSGRISKEVRSGSYQSWIGIADPT
jgi:hypothetical protein